MWPDSIRCVWQNWFGSIIERWPSCLPMDRRPDSTSNLFDCIIISLTNLDLILCLKNNQIVSNFRELFQIFLFLWAPNLFLFLLISLSSHIFIFFCQCKCTHQLLLLLFSFEKKILYCLFFFLNCFEYYTNIRIWLVNVVKANKKKHLKLSVVHNFINAICTLY